MKIGQSPHKSLFNNVFLMIFSQNLSTHIIITQKHFLIIRIINTNQFVINLQNIQIFTHSQRGNLLSYKNLNIFIPKTVITIHMLLFEILLAFRKLHAN